MSRLGKGLNKHSLKHFEVPKSFLKLPLVTNITDEPSQNYTLPLRGQIHAEKYGEILRYLETGTNEDWKSKVFEILDGNVIIDDLKDLSFSQFIDYLIHVAYANPAIDWNSIAILEKFVALEFHHISRWQLPDLDFKDDLIGFNASQIKVNMSPAVIDHIEAIVTELKVDHSTEELPLIIPPITLEKLKVNTLINLSDYFELQMNLSVLQQTGLIRYEQFPECMGLIASGTEKLLHDPIFNNRINKILFIVHYIMTYIKDDPKSIETCQNLLNLAVSEVQHLDDANKRSYFWLIDAAKAMIVNEVTKYNMEMVTEDLLLRSIGDRFLNPENADLQTWMHAIDSSGLPAELIIILIRGYLSVEKILHRYYLQLPRANTDNLVTLSNFVMSLLKSFDNYYNSKLLFKELSYSYQFFMVESWANAGFNQVKITPSLAYSPEPMVRMRIAESRFHDYFEMMMLCEQIITQSYDFEPLYQEIMAGAGELNHLIGNESFAKIFVDPFAKAFNFAQQRQINGVGVPIDSYLQLTYFIQSWLPYLLRVEDLVQDTIIMFLSFLKVVVNMIEAYYSEKGRFKSAKLWDLNYTLFELNLFTLYGYPQLNNINKMLSPEHIFNDFKKLLKHFDLSREITTIDKRYLVLDTVYDVSKFGLQQTESSVKPEKLLEHNIMEYLEMRNALDTFLKDLGKIPVDEIKNCFDVTQFKERDPPLTLLDHLKLTNHISNLHFPFIQPLNAFSAAIQFFDLDIEFPVINVAVPEPKSEE